MIMFDIKTIKAILTGTLLLACVGCAGPMFNTRPVQDEPSVFVGLASHNDPEKRSLGQHHHPKEWSETDLHAILTRLLVQKQGGIMDPLTHPRAVFSPDEILQLTPALRKTFKLAGPSDWVVFALWGSSQTSQALEVTSGGMFLENQRLHIILANYRERVSSEEDGIKGIRRNPFRSLRDIKKGKLLFDPARYIISSQDNWIAGGYDSPASELVLDLKSFLDNDRLFTPSEQMIETARDTTPRNSTPTAGAHLDVGELKEEISNLKEELSRLQELILKQAEERARQTGPQSTTYSP